MPCSRRLFIVYIPKVIKEFANTNFDDTSKEVKTGGNVFVFEIDICFVLVIFQCYIQIEEYLRKWEIFLYSVTNLK